MSIPPQIIRVKRKRDVETPVTFLQFDEDSKRQQSVRNWAYQRRDTTASQPAVDSKAAQPVIHVSEPSEARKRKKVQNEEDEPQISEKSSNASTEPQTSEKPSNASTEPQEPRRFHVSRAMFTKRTNETQEPGAISKKTKHKSTVFVESTRKKLKSRRRRNLAVSPSPEQVASRAITPDVPPEETVVEQRQLKKPGVSRKPGSVDTSQKPLNRTPLPDLSASRLEEDLDKITNDMNQWVLNELGANLQRMESDRQPLRFKPKSPAKRFHERHPELAAQTPAKSQGDAAANEVDGDEGDEDDEDDDDDDEDDENNDGKWLYDEYVRIPAHSVAVDVPSTEVGILVLGEEEESVLFFGSALDEDDELGEDDEDENAENYYAADYPEDEVDSDDEFGRQAYMYRHGNNSDDEEFDEILYEEQDEMVLQGDAEETDDARMARIKEFMQRNSAFR
ncbi:hypothetical protein E4U32_002542 [Claviceps aff. humidiphila group G2b]|nr:hypothetical protein E4U32_002542 [Claviceps aff. humidiphila group G2b]